MKHCKCCCFLFLFTVLILPVLGTEFPAKLHNQLFAVEGALSRPVVDVRIQVMRIARDVAIDPPPQGESFEKWATVSVTLNADYFRENVSRLVKIARESRWEPVDYEGYARWRVRCLGPWNEVLAELYIDEGNNWVLIGRRWYKTSDKTIQAFTMDLIRMAASDGKP